MPTKTRTKPSPTEALAAEVAVVPGLDLLRPFTALNRAARADTIDHLAQLAKDVNKLQAGAERDEAAGDGIALLVAGAGLYRLVSRIQTVLATVAVDEDAWTAWAESCSEAALLKVFQSYMDTVGEALASPR